VHEPECCPARCGRIREAEIDRDAARLLLRQPVGVHAGERLHERGLAVIDVPGRRDDHAKAFVTARELPKHGTYTECVPGPPATMTPMPSADGAMGSSVSAVISPSSPR